MDRIKVEFISNVSHELRTPLTSIRGSLGLIMGSMAAQSSEDMMRLLTIAHKNSERLILLINDILDLEKDELRKAEICYRLAQFARGSRVDDRYQYQLCGPIRCRLRA
ncbi:MAG: hypothetical protein MO852_14805 [Candidatus Devosia euplotis]|nr:hypothetical protein [Candidatus Devosia euplotis]